jgi:hypothetical protein
LKQLQKGIERNGMSAIRKLIKQAKAGRFGENWIEIGNEAERELDKNQDNEKGKSNVRTTPLPSVPAGRRRVARLPGAKE